MRKGSDENMLFSNTDRKASESLHMMWPRREG